MAHAASDARSDGREPQHVPPQSTEAAASVGPVADPTNADPVAGGTRLADTRKTGPQHSMASTLPPVEDSAALLEFYRERFASFERERQEWLQRVADIQVAHADLHRSEWELQVRQDEVSQLQDALGDANVQLFEEREETLKLLAENDQLKVQQAEDRRRIQHLLALTEPVTQEATFFKDCRPYLMTRKLHGSAREASETAVESAEKGRGMVPAFSEPDAARGAPREVQVVPNAKVRAGASATATVARGGVGRAGAATTSGGFSESGARRVLRTIYLPNEQTEVLAQRVASLERQLEDQSRIARERIEALEKDRVSRETHIKAERKDRKQHIAALEAKLAHAEEASRAAVKDYLELRHASIRKEQSLMEHMAALEADNKRVRHQLDTLSERLERETQAIRSSIMEDGERHVQRFRRQTMVAESNLNRERQQAERDLAETRARLEEVDAANAKLRKKCSLLDQRRKHDFEGFARDLAELRKQLRATEELVLGSGLENGTSLLASSHISAGDPGALCPSDRMKARANFLRNEIEMLRSSIQHLNNHASSANQLRERSQSRDEATEALSDISSAHLNHGRPPHRTRGGPVAKKNTKGRESARRLSSRPEWTN